MYVFVNDYNYRDYNYHECNSLTLRVEVYYKRRHDTAVFPFVRYTGKGTA